MKCLGVFAKWPEPGKVKTRLADLLGADEAARIARQFLLDTLDTLSALDVERHLVYSPADARAAFDSLVQRPFTLVPQAEGDLGDRLASFFKARFHAGASRVVVVGSDSPTLPLTFVEQAFEHLTNRDVCLGPATDGGYYLLGCRRWIPELFRDVAWSTASVLQQTVAHIRSASASLALLPPWYDVDTPEEWQMLCGHLDALRLASPDVTPQL